MGACGHCHLLRFPRNEKGWDLVITLSHARSWEQLACIGRDSNNQGYSKKTWRRHGSGRGEGGDEDSYGNWLVRRSLRLKPTALTCVKGRPETWGEELVRQDFKFWQHTC